MNNLNEVYYSGQYIVTRSILLANPDDHRWANKDYDCKRKFLLNLLAQIIDDGEVSCQMPTVPMVGSSANLFYCDTLVRLAQLSSLACKRAFSYQAFHRGAKSLVEAVGELHILLQDLKSSILHIFNLDAPVDPSNLPSLLSLHQVVYLQYAYFNTVLDIHTVVALPWSQNMLGLRSEPSLSSQLERSTQIVAKTCQDAILATKNIHLDASTPLPYVTKPPS